MAPTYFPVFPQLRFDPTEADKTETIQIPVGPSRFAKLLSFNKIESSRIIAEAKKELGSDAESDKDLLSEHIRQNITDIAVRLRLAENTPAYEPEPQKDGSKTKSHSGFVAKVLLVHPADPTKTKEKPLKVVAMTREGIEEKKKLLEHMFSGVMSTATRLDVAPEKLGNIFSALCPEDPTQNMGGNVGDAMGQAMGQMGDLMGGMMQGMMGAMGGAGGPPGRGGPQPGGGAGPECKQQ